MCRGTHTTNAPMFSIHIGCFLPYTDFSPDDWGPEFPLAAASSASRYAVPMPTLYTTEGNVFPYISNLFLCIECDYSA